MEAARRAGIRGRVTDSEYFGLVRVYSGLYGPLWSFGFIPLLNNVRGHSGLLGVGISLGLTRVS